MSPPPVPVFLSSYRRCPALSALPSTKDTTDAAVDDPARWETSTPSIVRIATSDDDDDDAASDAIGSRRTRARPRLAATTFAVRRADSTAFARASDASDVGRPGGRSIPCLTLRIQRRRRSGRVGVGGGGGGGGGANDALQPARVRQRVRRVDRVGYVPRVQNARTLAVIDVVVRLERSLRGFAEDNLHRDALVVVVVVVESERVGFLLLLRLLSLADPRDARAGGVDDAILPPLRASRSRPRLPASPRPRVPASPRPWQRDVGGQHPRDGPVAYPHDLHRAVLPLGGGGDDVHAQRAPSAVLREQRAQSAHRGVARRGRRANRRRGGALVSRVERRRGVFRGLAAVERRGGERRRLSERRDRVVVAVARAERERAERKRALEVPERAHGVRARRTEPRADAAGIRTADADAADGGGDDAGRDAPADAVETESVPVRWGRRHNVVLHIAAAAARQIRRRRRSLRRDRPRVDDEKPRHLVRNRRHYERRVRPRRVLQQHVQRRFKALDQPRLERERVALAARGQHVVYASRLRRERAVTRRTFEQRGG
eukprot:26893-Pelagococcus_subviridis.AAC.15